MIHANKLKLHHPASVAAQDCGGSLLYYSACQHSASKNKFHTIMAGTLIWVDVTSQPITAQVVRKIWFLGVNETDYGN